MLTKTEIEKILANYKIYLSTEKLDKLFNYYLLIEEKNKVMNLTGFHDERLIIEGFVESFLLLNYAFKLKDDQNYNLLDIGAGAGFPSVPYLIMSDFNINLTIIEPLKKRCLFLEEVSQKLNLNINIINKRAEDVKCKNYFDLVTARAVMELKYLVEVSCQLGKINSKQVFIKGINVNDELKSAQNIINLLGLDYKIIPYDTQGIRTNNLVYIIKKHEIDKNYPRPWNILKKSK